MENSPTEFLKLEKQNKRSAKMKLFKFKVNDEVKEFEFTKNDFQEFIEEINKTFKLQIKGFSYKDEEGDVISVKNEKVWSAVPNDKKIEIEFILEKKQE